MKRFTFLLSVLLSWPAAAEEACVVADDHPLIGSSNWYGVYFDSKKIGHAEEASERLTVDGMPVIDWSLSMLLRTGEVETSYTLLRRFGAAPPHRLLGGAEENEGLRARYYRSEGALVIEDDDGTRRQWQGVDRTLCDEEFIVLHRFLTSDPEIGSEIETTDFDIHQQLVTRASHRLKDVSERTIMGVRHLFHNVVSLYQEPEGDIVADGTYRHGEALQFFFGPLEMRRETEDVALTPNESVDFLAEFEKPLARPLDDLHAIRSLTLEVSIDSPYVTIHDVIGDAFLQKVTVMDDRTARVTIAEHPAPDSEQPSSHFLRATSAHPAEHPRIKALLNEALTSIDDRKDHEKVAATLVSFVSDLIEDAPNELYAHNSSSVLQILDRREGDCTEHSQLFVTLARAAGIPAREVTGFVYNNSDDKPALAGHVWAEVEIDGRWIGVDPTWNEVELNRSHVQTRNDLEPSLAFEVIDIAY